MNTIYLNDFVSIVGVISTVFGIITGYLFKKCTRDGRLIFYLKSLKIHYLKTINNIYGETRVIDDSPDDVQIGIEIDMHNSSFEYRNPSRFHLVVKGEYVEFRYQLLLNGVTSAPRRYSLANRFHEIEVPPRRKVTYSLLAYIKDDGIRILKANRYAVYLVYLENGSFKKILLGRGSRNDHFGIQAAYRSNRPPVSNQNAQRYSIRQTGILSRIR